MSLLEIMFEPAQTAQRHPKTDRLFLKRLVDNRAEFMEVRDAADRAHPIILRWAELESSGRLESLNETQLQGDFLNEIFGDILGFVRPAENQETWNLEQHYATSGCDTPDAVLGHFRQGQEHQPRVIVELKGAGVHLDRARSGGRNAVDQCWDYLANTPGCRWGIVSNLVSFRLYERDSTKRSCEHFTLQSLRNRDELRRFYAVFCRDALVGLKPGATPECDRLFTATGSGPSATNSTNAGLRADSGAGTASCVRSGRQLICHQMVT
jgi:hypothetical protein